MNILVSDTSVIVDLERGELLACAFSLPMTFVVPDILFERELRNYGGDALVQMGLRIESLDGAGVARAQAYQQAERRLTVPDSFALALAKENHWILLSGDGPLRALATADEVECHGVLWLLDEFEVRGVSTRGQLLNGLGLISGHARCRLPQGEVKTRLSRYSEQAGL